MFDIGWSELVVIAVVALIAIGPKELPGVLRMVGQWMGKARRMASDFQGQFNEAMREAEMADLKKTFDNAADIAKDLASTNYPEALTKKLEDAVKIDPTSLWPPESPATDAAAATEPSAATPVEAAAPALIEPAPAATTPATPPASSPTLPDAKVS